MSRIGRMPITVPSGVEITISGQNVAVKGPKGSLALNVAEPIRVSQEGSVITVARPNEERITRSLHGLSRTLVANLIEGVTTVTHSQLTSLVLVTALLKRVKILSSNSVTAT
jgi:large subunit ribosomal protein L6